MGMKAYVCALGLFNEEIRDCLEYPPEFYDQTEPGKLVFAHLFNCQTTRQSEELADLVGVQPWNFNTHLIASKRLGAEAKTQLSLFWDADELAKFERLVAAGFKMIYRPEG